jgi:hypothetical protein
VDHPSDAVDVFGPAVSSPTPTSVAAESTQTSMGTTVAVRERPERTVRPTSTAYVVKEPHSSGSKPRRSESESFGSKPRRTESESVSAQHVFDHK